MIILGLTGSIGMGKSTVAGLFAAEGVPVFEADPVVHALYQGAAVPLIEEVFPGTTKDGVVDRQALSKAVLGDPAAIKRLEAIVHPLVRQAEQVFIAAARKANAPIVVLDIPLLFETGGADRCNVIVVVSAPEEVQRERVLARPGMTPEKLSAILARQMPDSEKRQQANVVIDTSGDIAHTAKAVKDVIRRFGGSAARGTNS
ncbi:dephospho-CoA kinase [Flaviflagellibacter deserti]|uniref:Dephospho-CoA kinase n=1 Tax=Flaviflagellibacter deserti TaxID=2267266 RepID=A0ABV9Z5Z7_9HYPH